MVNDAFDCFHRDTIAAPLRGRLLASAEQAAAAQKPGNWHAGLVLGFQAGEDRTVLAKRKREGPLVIQRPFYPEGDVCHVYLLHPPGGVVGGDSITIEADSAHGTSALITTPGATKFYRSAGETACQSQTVRVGSGACMEWLPQENIFFSGALVDLSTRVDLEADARLVLWEIQCLGRPAADELFGSGHIDSRLEVYREGRPLLLERLRIGDDNWRRLSQMGEMAVGGIMLISHAGEEERAICQELMYVGCIDYSGITLLDDLLVVRYLGHSTERGRRLFTRVWQRVRESTVGRKPSIPRIWAT